MSLSNFVTAYPPKPYKFFEIFFSFAVKLKNLSCIYTTLWKELIRKSLCLPIFKNVTEIVNYLECF